MAKRHWIAEQPEESKGIDNPKIKWQPKRLPFKQGLDEVPITAFYIYGAILIALFVLVIRALQVLPPTIQVGQLFDLYSKEFPTVLYLGMIYGVLVYLIYRDIIRRSMSRILCVIPFMYFWLAVFMIFSF